MRFCISYFSHFCDKMANKNNSKGKSFLAHGLRAQSIVVGKARWRWWESKAASRVVSVVREQRNVSPGAELASPLQYVCNPSTLAGAAHQPGLPLDLNLSENTFKHT